MIADALHNCTLGASLLFCAVALLAAALSGRREVRWDARSIVLLVALCLTALVLLSTFGALALGGLSPG
jgi:uncharacterized membrane protein